MKKIIFGAFAAAALLSCSKDQLIEENRVNDEISFSVVAVNQTKAADVYCANNLMTEFQVSGTYTYEEETKWYFQNDRIAYETSAWTNKTAERYWTAGTHDFYAIVNGTMTLTAEPDVPTVDFTPATKVAEQTDLLYAVAKGKTKSSSAVALNFRHALSQIEFKAKNTNEKLHVEISGVRVGQTPGEGTFTFPSDATDGNFEDHNQADEIDDYTTGTWSVNTPTDYSVTFPTVKVTGNSSPIGLTLSTDAVGSSRNFTNSMLLLPTTATTAWTPGAGSTFNGTYLGVDCKIYNVAGASFDETTDICLHDGWAVIPASFAWEAGKKYIYTFVFGEGNGGYNGGGDPDTPTPGVTPVLTPITYTVTVDDFQKGEESDVNFEF